MEVVIMTIDKIDEENRNFGNIWKIYETKRGIIFQSFSHIFVYKNNEIEVLAHNREFHFGYYVNNKYLFAVNLISF